MDVLLPLGRDSRWQNNELRYCLRSIEKFATGYDRIFIIGEDPGFLNQESRKAGSSENSFSGIEGSCVPNSNIWFFPLKDVRGNKQARIAHKIFWAFQKTDISDQAVLFNDDYVLTAPTDLSRLPLYHRGSLFDAAQRQSDPVYKKSLEETNRVLQEASKPTFHYDIHAPMILERQSFLGLETWWQKSLAYPNGVGLVVKSVYANNTLPFPGPTIRDCKLRNPYPARILNSIIRDRWVFSYSDQGLTPTLKQWLVDRFPEKSKWEKATD
jgi:hypothetical protein